MPDNYYHILGLDSSASPAGIKGAYRKLAKKYHPDKNLNDPSLEVKFKRINEAYETLSNPDKKWGYDQQLERKRQKDYTSHQSDYTTSTPPKYRSRKSTYKKRRVKYKAGKITYTQGTLMFGKIFVIVLVMFVILFQVFLRYFSSLHNYNKGIEYIEIKDYREALVSLNQAIVNFGAKSTDAAILAARIEIEKKRNYKGAVEFCNQAFKHVEKKSDIAEIYYLRGICWRLLGSYNNARNDLEKSISFNSQFDSAYYHLGELNSLVFRDYDTGIKNFSELLAVNGQFNQAYFARGYCYQKVGDHQRAIDDLSAFLGFEANSAQAYYLKGLSELELNYIALACSDFTIALEMGMTSVRRIIRINCIPPNEKEEDQEGNI